MSDPSPPTLPPARERPAAKARWTTRTLVLAFALVEAVVLACALLAGRC